MTFCASATRAAAAGSTGAPVPSAVGQAAVTTVSPPVSAVHSASVTNGAIGCSIRSSASRTCPRTARVPGSVAGSSSWVLHSSTYQSASSSHAKW